MDFTYLYMVGLVLGTLGVNAFGIAAIVFVAGFVLKSKKESSASEKIIRIAKKIALYSVIAMLLGFVCFLIPVAQEALIGN
jgi:hypothetical protein